MRSIKDWLFARGPAPDPYSMVLHQPIIAPPVLVNPDIIERAKSAHYRNDAIHRHIVQHEAEGLSVSPERMREFFTETVANADMLLKAEVITREAHDDAIAFVTARLPKRGN